MSLEGPGDEITDGRVLHVKLVKNPKEPPINITDHMWTAGTFEKIFRDAGFTDFAWLPGPLRVVGENDYETEFYQVFAQDSIAAFFRARK